MASLTTTPVLFPWLEKYSVGIPQIDAQHQGLIRLINELHAAMGAGHGREAVGKILDELVRYTEKHFRFEENMLGQKRYTKLTAHQAEHKKLTSQVVELRNKFRDNSVALSLEVFQFLRDWLANHIMGHDQQYAAELKTR
jgi:hemerythrin-like metal-binding protein